MGGRSPRAARVAVFAQLTQRDTGSVLGRLGVKLHMTSASNFSCRGLGGVISKVIVAGSWFGWLQPCAWLLIACCSI